MAEELFALSAAEVAAFKELIEDLRRRLGTVPDRPIHIETDHQAPEVYVALVPTGGIPALTSHTGTGASEDDEPGYADCDIYHIGGSLADPTLERVTQLSRRVHNLGTSAVDAGTWVLVSRDKFGSWFVTGTVSGGGGDEVKIVQSNVAAAAGDGTFDANIQIHNADGTIPADAAGEAVWLRDANSLTTLIQEGNYLARDTGKTHNGRRVFMLEDSKLTVSNESFGQIVLAVLYAAFIPDRCWTVTGPADRVAYIKRILQAQETGGTLHEDVFKFVFDHANAWTITEASGVVTVVRELNIREGSTLRASNTWQLNFDSTDFDITSAGTSGECTVQTSGYTGTVGDFYRYQCVGTGTDGGDLTELVSTGFSVTRGLVKGDIAAYV